MQKGHATRVRARLRSPRGHHRGSADGPRQVVVIGGGLAGAFAAAAACGPGRSVTVLERDVLPDRPGPRPGVPQDHQPHVFLYRGLLAAEELLPGLRADLLRAGAVPFDTGDLAWLAEFGWAATGQPQFEVLSATRPLFEHVVLRRVRALPGVGVRAGARVSVLRRGSQGRPRWRVELADGSVEEADLVVDTSGRGSRLPVWLSLLGLPPARTTEVDARIGYAARQYTTVRHRPGVAGIVLLQTPDTRAGAMALPVESGGWLVGAVGAGERRPPRDPVAFEQFLAGLRDPALAQLTSACEPAGNIAVHRQTGNRRHHYERLRRWPDGLVVMGDALCAFNPVYGQGVTVAACEALLLRRALQRGVLRRRLRSGARRSGERRLLRQFSAVVALPWAIATGEDLRYPTCEGSPSAGQDLLGRWSRELSRLACSGDVRAQSTLARVYHLMAPPRVLFSPALVAAAVRARLRGYGPPTPRPEIFTGS